MDVTLEQSLASAVRYIQEHDIDGARNYFDEVPESFYVPSRYFPVPNTSSRKVSLSAYCTEITMEVWFMDRTDWEANARATAIRNQIILNRCRLPIVNSDGSYTGEKLRVKEPELRKIDEGIVRATILIQDYFRVEDDALEKVQEYIYNWRKATEKYR